MVKPNRKRLKNKTNRNRLTETEHKLTVIAGGEMGGGTGERGEGAYKRSKPWGCNVQPGECTPQCNKPVH